MKLFIPKKPYQLFIIMLFLSLIFGLSSYNLFFLLQENIRLVIDYGIMALIDGTFFEIIKLCAYGVISLFCYLMFKACENLFIEHLSNED